MVPLPEKKQPLVSVSSYFLFPLYFHIFNISYPRLTLTVPSLFQQYPLTFCPEAEWHHGDGDVYFTFCPEAHHGDGDVYFTFCPKAHHGDGGVYFTFCPKAHHGDGGVNLSGVHPGTTADAVVALLEERQLCQQQRRRDLQRWKLVQDLQHVRTLLILPVLVGPRVLGEMREGGILIHGFYGINQSRHRLI